MGFVFTRFNGRSAVTEFSIDENQTCGGARGRVAKTATLGVVCGMPPAPSVLVAPQPRERSNRRAQGA